MSAQRTDANGVLSVNSYDLRQRLLSSSVGGQTTSYAYDAAGQLKKVTLPDTSWVGYDYDDARRQATNTVYSKSGTTSQTYGWAYDQTGVGYANGVGRLTSTTHPSGSTQYTYDAQGKTAHRHADGQRGRGGQRQPGHQHRHLRLQRKRSLKALLTLAAA